MHITNQHPKEKKTIYIKLFESFKKEDYYTQVTKVDWNNFIGIEMDKSIYNQIEEFYLHNIKGDGTKLQEDHYINNDEPQIEFLGIKIYLSKIGGGDRRVVSIIQSEDEWFWTWVFNTYENKSEYYKCDQLEGLFNLLNNINDEISINESKMEKDVMVRIHWEGYYSYYGHLLSVYTDGKGFYVKINGEYKEISKNDIQENFEEE